MSLPNSYRGADAWAKRVEKREAERVRKYIEGMAKAARERGDDITASIMDKCGICRCPDHYRIISGLLAQYRKRIKRSCATHEGVKK